MSTDADAADALPTEAVRKLEEIPGPSPMPILGWRGNLLRYFRDPLAYLFGLRRRYGTLARFVDGENDPIVFRPGPGARSTVCVLGPESARDVLTRPEDFRGSEFRAPKGFDWINESMVTADGESLRQRRSVMGTAFHREHLRSYLPEVVNEMRRLLHRWSRVETIDLAAELYEMATGVASKCFFGQPRGSQRTNLARKVRRFAELLMSPIAAVPLDFPGTPYHQLCRSSRELQDAFLSELGRKRESEETGDDVMAMLVEAQEDGRLQISDRQLMGDAVALFLAGHDVPANAITFALLLLTQHPEVVAELADELDREVDGDVPEYEQLWELPVLDRVVRESLRLWGPTLLILRRAVRDGRIGEYEVPAGTEVLISPFVIHRDPELYEHPRRFAPDRWLDGRNRSAFEYLPFSYGARRCLGASMAELMTKLVIAMVVGNVRLIPPANLSVDVTSTFVVSPKGQVRVGVRPRDDRFEDSRRGLSGGFADLIDFT